MKLMNETEPEGLTRTEVEVFMKVMARLVDRLEYIDGKPHHVAVMIFTREDENEEQELVSTHVLATTSAEHLQELLHSWIMRKIQ